MKKFLIIFGFFILFFISFGTLFKLMHWPGSGSFLAFGILFFAFIFLPIFFIQRIISNKSALNIITNILGMCTTSIMFMGVLFKVMRWPGAGPMIVFGTTFFVFPTLVLYVVQQLKEEGRKFSEFWRLVVGAVLTSVFLFFYALKPSKNILTTFTKVEDATLKTNKNLEESNFRLLSMLMINNADPAVISASKQIHASTQELVSYIDHIKSNLIQSVDYSSVAVDNHWLVNSKDNYDVPTHVLGTSDSQTGIALWQYLNNYKKTIREQLEMLPFDDKEKMITEFGDFGVVTELRHEQNEEHFKTWQEGMFYDVPLSGTLALLSGIQNELWNAEFITFQAIAGRENMKKKTE